MRHVLRGMPWLAAGILVMLITVLMHKPLTGGALLLMVVLWLVGCTMMTTRTEPKR